MIKISKLHLAILALILANIIWGAASPILKWALQDIQPFTLAFLRFFLSALILFPFTVHNLRIKKSDILFVLLLAFIGFTIHIGSYLWGLKLAPSINAPIIGSAAPVFIVIGSIAFLREKLKKKVIIGTIVSLLGVIIVVGRPLLEEHTNGAVGGNLFFVLGTIAFVVYTMMLKKIEGKYPILTLTFWTFAIASIFFFPASLLESHATGGFLTGLTMQGLIGIFYSTILTSIIAYLGFTYALKHIPASEVGIYLYLDPVIAILIAIPLLGETLTIPYIVGSILVFLGIFIAEGRLHYHPIHKLRTK